MALVIRILNDWGSEILSGISLLVSIFSLVKSSKAQKIQNKINDLELLIKKYEIEKIEKEKKNATVSCVEARIINTSKGKYKMKVWNSGGAVARNITVEPDENVKMAMMGDMLPFEELDSGKGFDISLVVFGGTKRKFYVTTKWVDEENNNQSKKQMVSL